MPYVEQLAARLREQRFADRPVEVEVDNRDLRGGEKTWSWIKRGVPLRVEVGPRDVEASAVTYARRDETPRDKHAVPLDEFVGSVSDILGAIQQQLFDRAKEFRETHTRDVNGWDKLERFFTPKNADQPEIHGGFARVHWCGSSACEERMNELKVTIRCIPLDAAAESGRCVACGGASQRRVVCAKSY
jgi:prolyl-tRNA synthetase